MSASNPGSSARQPDPSGTQRLLLWVAGANQAAFDRLDDPKVKRHAMMVEAGLGAVVVGTAVVATLATGFATTQWFPGNSPAVTAFIAVVGGLLFGTLIFNLDRFMLLRMTRQLSDRRTLLFALPRIFVAATLGFFVAQPLAIEMNRSEVRLQAERNRAAEVDDLAQKNAKRATDVSNKRAEVNKLALEASGAGRYSWVSNSNYVNALKQANRANTELGKAADCTQAEVDGSKLPGCGNTGSIGFGPAANAKRAATNSREAAASKAQAQLDSVASGLQESARLADERNRNSAQASLESEQQNLKIMEAELGKAQKNQRELAAQEIGAPGLEKALWQRSVDNPAVAFSVILLTLVLLALDAGPVVFKALTLTGEKSPYDEANDDVRDHVREDQQANRSIRNTQRQARIARDERRVMKRSEADEWEDAQTDRLYREHRQRWIDGVDAAWKAADAVDVPQWLNQQFRRPHGGGSGTTGHPNGANGSAPGAARGTRGTRRRAGNNGNRTGPAAGNPTDPVNDGTTRNDVRRSPGAFGNPNVAGGNSTSPASGSAANPSDAADADAP